MQHLCIIVTKLSMDLAWISAAAGMTGFYNMQEPALKPAVSQTQSIFRTLCFTFGWYKLSSWKLKIIS
jgi:hypothetical protein